MLGCLVAYARTLSVAAPPFDDDEYFVHLFSPEYERFDKHTLDSYCEAAAHLKHVAESTPARLLEEEKNIGIKYDPEGVLWDPEVFARLQPPSCEYPDWMHNIAASGGGGRSVRAQWLRTRPGRLRHLG